MVPVGVGGFLFTHHLGVGLSVLPLLLFAGAMLNFFPTLILSLQVFESFAFDVHLFLGHLLVALLAIEGGEVLLESLEG